jgi:hypothetical protein
MAAGKPLHEAARHHVVGEGAVAVEKHHGLAFAALDVMEAHPVHMDEAPARRVPALGGLGPAERWHRRRARARPRSRGAPERASPSPSSAAGRCRAAVGAGGRAAAGRAETRRHDREPRRRAPRNDARYQGPARGRGAYRPSPSGSCHSPARPYQPGSTERQGQGSREEAATLEGISVPDLPGPTEVPLEQGSRELCRPVAPLR